jgi:pSer/pThr/pTyr-binding forkhead associated (FHA) protein
MGKRGGIVRLWRGERGRERVRGIMDMAKLVLKFRDATLQEIPITKSSLTIGRVDKNDIKIENLAVSRQHAKIVQDGDRYIMEDLNSLNGTFVNEKKVMKCILRNGDEILVGKHTIVFVDEEEKPIEMRKDIDISLAEKTVILDTERQRELVSQTEEEKGTIREKPSDLKGGIRIISGGVGQEDIELTKRLTTGGKGDGADIKLRGFFVGKISFIISKRPNGFFITHSGGRSMTKVNGMEVEGQRELKDGDIIDIGSTSLQFYSYAQSDGEG